MGKLYNFILCSIRSSRMQFPFQNYYRASTPGKPSVANRPQENLMDCIIPPVQGRMGLYIGSIQAAQSFTLLKQHGIYFVLTLSYEQDLQYADHTQIVHKAIKCRDLSGFAIRELFSQAHQFIDEAREQGNILVHCMAGISRSASVCISYLMKKEMITLEHALSMVKQIRPSVRPNPGFLRQLLDFEKEIFGCINSRLSQSLTPYFQVQDDPQYQPQQLFMMPQQAFSRNVQQQIQPKTQFPIETKQQYQLNQQSPIKAQHNIIATGKKSLQEQLLPLQQVKIMCFQENSNISDSTKETLSGTPNKNQIGVSRQNSPFQMIVPQRQISIYMASSQPHHFEHLAQRYRQVNDTAIKAQPTQAFQYQNQPTIENPRSNSPIGPFETHIQNHQHSRSWQFSQMQPRVQYFNTNNTPLKFASGNR